MEEKAVWIDEEKRILSFHPFENSRVIMKEENIFWDFIVCKNMMYIEYL